MRTLLACLAFAASFAASFTAAAEDYPSKAVTIVVPYPAGGPTDQLARQLSPRFSEKLGQPFVVENVSGGATTIATGRVAHAAPDGYTLLLHNLQISANVTLYPKAPYDTEKDLTPVGFVNRNALVLIGRNKFPPSNFAELLAYMKGHQINFAIAGSGTTGHLVSALMLQETGLSSVLIPYRGAAPAMADILGDHVDIYFATPQQALPLVTSGKIKAYGVTSREKIPGLENATSMVDALGPKFEIYYWQAIFAPAGTPKPILDKLNAVLQEAEDDPALVKSWAETGVSPFPKDQRSPEAGAAIMKSEIARWGEVIRVNHIQPE